MASKLRLLVACGCLLSLSACVESEHPISDVSNSEQDPRLYGVWSLTDSGNTSYVLIGAEATEPLDRNSTSVEPGLMRYWSIDLNDESHQIQTPNGAKFFRTKIGNEDFANWVTPPDKDHPGKPTTYFFLKYRVDDNQLTVWLQDPEITAQAIEAGKLKGEVKRKPKAAGSDTAEVESLRITDTSENIKAFLAAGGSASCFLDKNSVVYKRVR